MADANGKPSRSICGMCSAPEDEGEYEFRYGYGPGARLAFRVVQPQFEGWTQTVLQDKAQFKDVATGRTLTMNRVVRFAVLGYQGSHIVVVAVNPKTGAAPPSDPSGRFSRDASRSFSPFRRIATSGVPITSLQAVADKGENVTLTYTDQQGRTSTIKLNAKRELAP